MEDTPAQLKAKIDQAKRMIKAAGDQLTTQRLEALLQELEDRQKK